MFSGHWRSRARQGSMHETVPRQVPPVNGARSMVADQWAPINGARGRAPAEAPGECGNAAGATRLTVRHGPEGMKK